MKIGSHVSNNGELMLEGSAKQAAILGANCFMLYLGAPQNTFRKPFSLMHSKEMQEVINKLNISIEDVIVHAPYIVNLAQNDDDKWQYAVDFITNEVKLCFMCGMKYMVLHPGAHVGMGYEYGIKRISEGLIQILNRTKETDVVICLETMAGKGTEVGCTFEQIKAIMDLVKSDRIQVCLDTCHIFDAGYDIVNHYDEVLNEFNDIISFKNLKVIHLNDSKNILGSKKDRHENIGLGNIGFETLHRFVVDKRFENIPKILETPYVKDPNSNMQYEPYKDEIIMLKNGIFNENLIEDILNSKIE